MRHQFEITAKKLLIIAGAVEAIIPIDLRGSPFEHLVIGFHLAGEKVGDSV